VEILMNAQRTTQNRPSLVLWLLVAAAMLAMLLSSAHASDIQRGVTFQDGQRLTASQLHALIDDASITTGFIVNKPTATSLESGAYLILYSPAGQSLEKIPASTFLYGNTDFITTQAEKTSPAANDFVLIYDTAGTVLAKAQIGNLYSNSVGTLPPITYTNATLTGTFVPVINGTNGIMSVSNLFLLFPYSAIFTNLPVRSHPTNFDNLLLAASDDGTNFSNQRISLAGLFTSLNPGMQPTNAVPTNGTVVSTNFYLLAYQQTVTNGGATNAVVCRIDLTQLRTYFSNVFVPNISKPVTFTSAEIPITNTIMYLDFPHGLAGTPQISRCVLLCKTAEADYVAGDEIVFDTGVKDSADGKYGTYGGNTTNLFFNFKVDGRIQVPDKVTGGLTTLAGLHGAAVTNWKLKFYATYYPP
jgi:hypothetical protein